MKNKFFYKFRLKFEYYVIYFLYLLSSLLPSTLMSKLGGLIFRFIGPMTKLQRVVKKNIIKIFPDIKKFKIKKISLDSWENTGKTFFELLTLSKIINNQNRINIEGIENIKNVMKESERVIFIGIHQSNWEILLPSIDKLGIPVAGIYRHINNPYIDKLILNIRKKSINSKQSFYTPKGKKSARDIIESVKNKTSIVLLIDQKDSAGETVSFFSFPAKTQTGFIKIAKKYNLRIFPVQNIRNNDNTFTLRFHKPLDKLKQDQPDKNTMLEIHNIIEQWIKSKPSDWFLQHNRFS